MLTDFQRNVDDFIETAKQHAKRRCETCSRWTQSRPNKGACSYWKTETSAISLCEHYRKPVNGKAD